MHRLYTLSRNTEESVRSRPASVRHHIPSSFFFIALVLLYRYHCFAFTKTIKGREYADATLGSTLKQFLVVVFWGFFFFRKQKNPLVSSSSKAHKIADL